MQTQVIEWKPNLLFGDIDLGLDHRHVSSNLRLHSDISNPYTKFGVNRSKQTQLIDPKPKVDDRPPGRLNACRLQHYNNRFSLNTG